MATTKTKIRPKPFLFPRLCKACGRCIEACPKHCIELGTEIDPVTGFTPVHVNLESCNGCGLCISACPEPFGLMPRPPEMEGIDLVVSDPFSYFGPREPLPEPESIADGTIPLGTLEPMVLKGNHAAAIGALLAGCRHFFGYPITPSTEGAELMAQLLPRLNGVFVQAVSEVATVNMMYGCGGAGMRCMTFTSSPGFSLMLEGISYMIGAQIPGVFVNVMRGGPGLGNIAPEQGDIKLVCRGLGHGNTHALTFAPSTPQEMLDLAMLAFDKSFEYRNPVIIVGDGYLGQMTGRVTLPTEVRRPGLPSWAVYGDAAHRGNLNSSIDLDELRQEAYNVRLNEKYAMITQREQRAERFILKDAEWIILACNTPARMAKGAVHALRERGVAAGLFRPITLWPFPIEHLLPLLSHAKGLIVVEASSGQLEDELRLAMSHAGIAGGPRISHVRRLGGVLPSQREIVDHVGGLAEVRHG